MYKFLTIILVIWSAKRLLCCNHYDYTHTPGSSNTSKWKKKKKKKVGDDKRDQTTTESTHVYN
jgi:hypothetical protein